MFLLRAWLKIMLLIDIHYFFQFNKVSSEVALKIWHYLTDKVLENFFPVTKKYIAITVTEKNFSVQRTTLC